MRQVDDGVIDDSWPLTTATLQLLLADYRHHRPTQWAYDAACAALRKRPTHSEHEKALAEVDRLNQRVASLDRQLDAAMRRIVALRTGADEDEESAR
jgi:beta-phosphoglucomutase-like phosphatase (HAD superfamily)